jgi:hypothetical protein
VAIGGLSVTVADCSIAAEGCLKAKDPECKWNACKKCCSLTLTAQGGECEAVDHVAEELDPDGSHGDLSDRMRTFDGRRKKQVVKVPEGMKMMKVYDSNMVFCPYSLLQFHYDTGRGQEVLLSKVALWTTTLGRKVSPVNFCDARDAHEVDSLASIVAVMLNAPDMGIKTDYVIELLRIPVTRLYALMIVKSTQGGAGAAAFSDVLKHESIPDGLREAHEAAMKAGAARAVLYKKQKEIKGRGGGGRQGRGGGRGAAGGGIHPTNAALHAAADAAGNGAGPGVVADT